MLVALELLLTAVFSTAEVSCRRRSGTPTKRDLCGGRHARGRATARPRADVVHDGVGDAADQITADLGATEILEIGLIIPGRHAAGMRRDYLPRVPRWGA